jgi:hypothetical protein
MKKMEEQIDKEIIRLRKGFTNLNMDYKRGVLKSAQGLLRIQRTYKAMITDNTGSFGSRPKNTNG